MGMLTFMGLDFDPETYTYADFDHEDIAHALAHNNRYNGHASHAYSVGLHSLNLLLVLKEYKVNPETMMYGLMHDASEAYLSDVPTPMKIKMPIYLEWEKRIMEQILLGVGENHCLANPKAWLKEIDYDLVHKIDKSMVLYEMRVLFPNRPKELTFNDVMLLPTMNIKSSTAQADKTAFMYEYGLLQKELTEKYKGFNNEI